MQSFEVKISASGFRKITFGDFGPSTSARIIFLPSFSYPSSSLYGIAQQISNPYLKSIYHDQIKAGHHASTQTKSGSIIRIEHLEQRKETTT
jgi:hypothetical protein